MISEYSVDKALIDVAAQIQTDTGFKVVVDGSTYNPSTDETYIKEKVIRGVYDRPISKLATQRQQGIYQLTMCTPINRKKYYHMQQVDILKPYFLVGFQSNIQDSGQKISVLQTEQSSMFYNEQNTHMQTAFQVRYNVIG